MPDASQDSQTPTRAHDDLKIFRENNLINKRDPKQSGPFIGSQKGQLKKSKNLYERGLNKNMELKNGMRSIFLGLCLYYYLGVWPPAPCGDESQFITVSTVLLRQIGRAGDRHVEASVFRNKPNIAKVWFF